RKQPARRPAGPSMTQKLPAPALPRSGISRRPPCAAIDERASRPVTDCLALNPLLLTVHRGLHAGGCARIFSNHLAEGGAGGFLFLQRRQRLAEAKQRVGRLAGLVVFGGHAEEGFGRLAVLLTLKIAFTEPVLRIRDQGIAGIFLREILHGLLSERIVLALH